MVGFEMMKGDGVREIVCSVHDGLLPLLPLLGVAGNGSWSEGEERKEEKERKRKENGKIKRK